MHIYLVYDKSTGRILHSVSKYVLGNAEPVAMSPDEVRAELADALQDTDIGIARVPEGFDPRDRSRRVVIDARAGLATTVAAPERPPRDQRPTGTAPTPRRQPTRSARKGGRK